MRAFRHLIAFVIAAVLAVQPALAQSVLRDAETESLFLDMSAPMIRAAGLDPKNVRVVVVNDTEINAFASQGQDVYLNAGLIMAAKNANEVQGVIAHELGHVAAGDVLRGQEGIKKATGIMILSMILGAAAMAAGGGEAGAGIFAAGQQAALGKYIAFTRVQEAGADESARRFLRGGGVSGKGMISFFKTLQNQEYRLRLNDNGDGFGNDHPVTSDRIAVLSDTLPSDPAWNTPTPDDIEARFQRVKAKLTGFILDPKVVVNRFPLTDNSVPAHLARAYAYHRGAYPDRAVYETDALLATAPHDPYFLEMKGQILLESGRPTEAIPILREAVARTNYQPLIAALFGHALIESGDRANYAEAKIILKNAIQRDGENPFAWYQLGVIYTQEGDQPRAALASAERWNLEGQARPALAAAETAMHGLPPGSADYLRAQDISMISRTQAEKDKKDHKRS
ncbi:Orange domain-containing protein [Sphingomonas antarctica]|uniref:M48 family metalloprotease n=1 Tax=Sphingomonas antarctica TaxID=2040274 RepID=UPI0039ED23A2